MEHGKELLFGLWLSEHCSFENDEAIILKKTGRLYYKDSIRDMTALHAIFVRMNRVRLMVMDDEMKRKFGLD